MNAIKLHWLPDRKFLAAGLSGIATWLLTRALAYAGVEIPAELQTAAVGLVMGAVHYFVPPHIMDILRRIDGDLKSTFPAQVIGTAQKLALAFLLLGGLALGGPIAFIENGDEIVVDLNVNELNCPAIADPDTLAKRKAGWDKAVADNGGIHPNCGVADTRLLHRARHTAVPATRGGGLHPNREIWVREPRAAERSGFVPKNRHRPQTNKAF